MRRDKSVYVVMIIMGMVSILSLTFACFIGALYIQERDAVETINETQMRQAIDGTAEQTELLESEVDELLAQRELDVKASMKQKMKELVEAKDGGPLTMLRYFFPENLIFYDEGGYVFAPILAEIKKHSLMQENFIKLENGEMTYQENGEIKSHKGIDVSKYQGKIDWKAVKEDGVEYAFIRLGLRGYESGKVVLDEYFKQNMRDANNAGVKVGVYFFTQAITVEEAKEEAEFVIKHLADYDVPYPVVFDVEMIVGGDGRANKLSKEERTDICVAFCESIKEAGYTPMIYGNVKCFTKLIDMTRLEAYEKWYAFYGDYMYFPYEVSMWQYTESGTVNGIKGDVDLNISFKTW